MGNCCGTDAKAERENPFAPKDGNFEVQSPMPSKGTVIKHNPFPDFVNKDVADFYNIGRELGRGEFGVTCLVVNKVTGERLACKSIPKRKLKTAIDVEDVRREVAIMNHLPPHPNIVGLRGVFEDKAAVHIVQELCEGGELFERIIAKGHYSERAAASVTKTIVEIVQTCHRHGVMHRDLKPENFLFANKEEDAPLRAIDFGLSVMFQPGDAFSEIVGSPYYMAPEVLRRSYGPEADVWSAGVILYILLCGVPPFWAESEQGVAQQVLRAKVDFRREPWEKVSEAAKALVQAMLEPEVSKRLTAAQVLDNPWIRDASIAPDTPLGTEVLARIKNFSAMNQLKKKALQLIAENLDEEEVVGLKDMFKMMDSDHSGSISLEELKVGLKKIGSPLTGTEVQKLLEAADLNGDGMIDYSEFVAATMHLQRADNDDRLRIVFDSFDKDHSGLIDFDELAQALGLDKNDPNVHKVLSEVDENNDGQISFEEFSHMMRKGSEWRKNIRHFSKERSYLGDVVEEESRKQSRLLETHEEGEGGASAQTQGSS